ncbi:hypothetical protein NCCP691_08790 [Noviherbaspirillum aridicola]|uniref:Outer-membrane lipoprotein LolB n=1 Tax=Noviherbaspirillum aridicola TaxID=2849687 RepID=A0ABQ4Q143_9BURK|nr:hypothetical protein NCCP691_08790 [Noviherbaspirillum aridicola]
MRLALVASSLALAGCAALPPPGAAPAAAAQRDYHARLELGGRLSVRYQGTQKEESVHGSFVWAQAPERTGVTLLSPLGQTVAVIEAGPAGATMAQPGQPMRVAPDVDTLTAEALGWPLPVAGMREWLQGFATDSDGRRFIASPRRDQVLTHDGWRIHYAAWSDEGRPRRIDLSRSTEQAGEVSIRIVIDSWQAS